MITGSRLVDDSGETPVPEIQSRHWQGVAPALSRFARAAGSLRTSLAVVVLGVVAISLIAPPEVARSLRQTVVVAPMSAPVAPADHIAQRATVGQPTRLTPPGCCPAARWLADSRRVVFYHLPDQGTPGAWTADESGALTLLWPRFGHVDGEGKVIASQVGDTTLVEHLVSGAQWTLANDGVESRPAPDGRSVAYLARLLPGGRTYDSQERVMVNRLDGRGSRALLDLARADYLSWFPDSRRLVVFGWRPEGSSPGLWVIDTDTGQSQQIVAANFLTAIAVSPDGQWIAYLAALQPTAAENGVWIVRPDGSDLRRIAHERGFHWAADSQALLALTPVAGGKEIHRIDIASNTRSVVVAHADVDFDVEADDWSVAPDGHAIVYRSSRDRALWVLPLSP